MSGIVYSCLYWVLGGIPTGDNSPDPGTIPGTLPAAWGEHLGIDLLKVFNGGNHLGKHQETPCRETPYKESRSYMYIRIQ